MRVFSAPYTRNWTVRHYNSHSVCRVKTKLKTVTAQLVRIEMQLEVVSFQ